MSRAEREGLVYLFRLRMTAKVKRGVVRLTGEGGWVDAGRGWGARERELRLSGWSRQRRVVVLHRRLRDGVVGVAESAVDGHTVVLVTSLAADLEILGQLYRDRAMRRTISTRSRTTGVGAASRPMTWPAAG